MEPTVGRDALAGKPVTLRVPPTGATTPKGAASDRRHTAIGYPEGYPLFARCGRAARQLVSSLGALWQAVKPTAGTRPSWRREPLPNQPSSSRVRQAGRSCLAVPVLTRRQAPIEPDGSRPKFRTSRRTLVFGGSEPRQNSCCRAVVCGSKRRAGRSKLRPALHSSPCDLVQTRRPASGHDHIRRAHDPTPTQIWHFGALPPGGRSKPLP